MDMALHSLLEGDVDLLVDKCEDGHCVVGNQTEETIEAYRKRDREHIDDIKVSAAQHVKRQALARSSDTCADSTVLARASSAVASMSC